jgi:hypothetical protein
VRFPVILGHAAIIISRGHRVCDVVTPDLTFVRRQVFWDNRLFELTEALVHQGYHFMLPPLGEASGVV